MYALIVFLPLFGALIAGFLSLYQRDRAAEVITISGLLLSFMLSLIAFANVAIGGNAGNGKSGSLDLIRRFCRELELAF